MTHLHEISRKWFWRQTELPGREVFVDVRGEYERCLILVRVFYCFLLYNAIDQYPNWQGLVRLTEPDLLWPVAWAALLPWALAVKGVTLTHLFGCLAAAFWPGARLARVAAFAGILMAVALFNSYGKINHNDHPLILAALVLVFLPGSSRGKRPSPGAMRGYCETFWGAQATMLLLYTIAGFMKLLGVLTNLQRGEKTVFHLDGPAMILARDFLRTDKETMIGHFVLDHPVLLAYPLFVATIYLELFAVGAAFRPSLTRIWGGALIAVHLGISLVMEIHFVRWIFLLGLLFLASPFRGRGGGAAERVRDLPWIGPFLSALGAFLRSRGRGRPGAKSTVYADPRCGVGRRIDSLLERLGVPPGFEVRGTESRDYVRLEREYPYLEDIDGLVVVSAENGRKAVRLKSEAALWLLSHFRGAWGWSFLLLLIPVPLLDLGYAFAAWRGRRASS